MNGQEARVRRLANLSAMPSVQESLNSHAPRSLDTICRAKPDTGTRYPIATIVHGQSGDKDVFVHITMIERSGLSRLVEGQRVRMIIAKGDRGNEVVSIKLLDGTR